MTVRWQFVTSPESRLSQPGLSVARIQGKEALDRLAVPEVVGTGAVQLPSWFAEQGADERLRHGVDDFPFGAGETTESPVGPGELRCADRLGPRAKGDDDGRDTLVGATRGRVTGFVAHCATEDQVAPDSGLTRSRISRALAYERQLGEATPTRRTRQEAGWSSGSSGRSRSLTVRD